MSDRDGKEEGEEKRMIHAFAFRRGEEELEEFLNTRKDELGKPVTKTQTLIDSLKLLRMFDKLPKNLKATLERYVKWSKTTERLGVVSILREDLRDLIDLAVNNMSWVEFLEKSFRKGTSSTEKYLGLFEEEIEDSAEGISYVITQWNELSNALKDVKLVGDRVLVDPYLETDLYIINMVRLAGILSRVGFTYSMKITDVYYEVKHHHATDIATRADIMDETMRYLRKKMLEFQASMQPYIFEEGWGFFPISIIKKLKRQDVPLNLYREVKPMIKGDKEKRVLSFLQLLNRLGYVEFMRYPLIGEDLSEKFSIELIARLEAFIPHLQTLLIDFFTDMGYKIAKIKTIGVKLELDIKHVGKLDSSLYSMKVEYKLPYEIVKIIYSTLDPMEIFQYREITESLRDDVFSLIGEKVASLNISKDQWVLLFIKALEIIFDDDFSADIDENTYFLRFNSRNLAECIYTILTSFLNTKGLNAAFQLHLEDNNIKITIILNFIN
ncbi:MAG: hypothetical protein GF329_01515 [Candidatus Lokiarchaeota archaeon]|nr:hypothetical protein [Candidatus Lokiarchaeota archaeon]